MENKEIIKTIKDYFEKKSISLQKQLNTMGKQVEKFEKATGCINYLKIGLDEVEEELLKEFQDEPKGETEVKK